MSVKKSQYLFHEDPLKYAEANKFIKFDQYKTLAHKRLTISFDTTNFELKENVKYKKRPIRYNPRMGYSEKYLEFWYEKMQNRQQFLDAIKHFGASYAYEMLYSNNLMKTYQLRYSRYYKNYEDKHGKEYEGPHKEHFLKYLSEQVMTETVAKFMPNGNDYFSTTELLSFIGKKQLIKRNFSALVLLGPQYYRGESESLSIKGRETIIDYIISNFSSGIIEAIIRYQHANSSHWKKDKKYFLEMSLSEFDRNLTTLRYESQRYIEINWNALLKSENLANPANIKRIMNANIPKLDLIYADSTAVSSSKKNGILEHLYFNHAFNVILCMFILQKKKGCGIVPYGFYWSDMSMEYIYLLRKYYKKIHIMKPLSSSITNARTYIICENFKGITKEDIDKLLAISAKMYKKNEYGGVKLSTKNPNYRKEFFMSDEPPLDYEDNFIQSVIQIKPSNRSYEKIRQFSEYLINMNLLSIYNAFYLQYLQKKYRKEAYQKSMDELLIMQIKLALKWCYYFEVIPKEKYKKYLRNTVKRRLHRCKELTLTI